MARYRIIDPTGPDKPYATTELYSFFKPGMGGGICHVIMNSTFSLSQKTLENVKEEIMPKLTNAERRSVEGIGKIMRKYIDEDLEFIKKTYLW